MANVEDFTAEILQALADADRLTKAAIVAELEPLRSQYEDALEVAAKALAEAYELLLPARSMIDQIDAKIAEFQVKAEEYKAAADDPGIEFEDIITASFYADGFAVHIRKLQDHRAELSEELRRLEDEHVQAKNAHHNAQTELNVYELNLQNPYLHLGQRTTSYAAFRIGSFGLWLAMLNDTHQSEKDAFYAGLDEIAVKTGYRTENLDERMRRRALEQELQELRDNFPGAEKTFAPSGQDIVNELHHRMQNQFAGDPVNVMEYRENFRIPVAQRDYMSAPRAAETAKKL